MPEHNSPNLSVLNFLILAFMHILYERYETNIELKIIPVIGSLFAGYLLIKYIFKEFKKLVKIEIFPNILINNLYLIKNLYSYI